MERLDHGIRSLEDPRLLEYLRRTQIPLTTCPLSNLHLQARPVLISAMHSVCTNALFVHTCTVCAQDTKKVLFM